MVMPYQYHAGRAAGVAPHLLMLLLLVVVLALALHTSIHVRRAALRGGTAAPQHSNCRDTSMCEKHEHCCLTWAYRTGML